MALEMKVFKESAAYQPKPMFGMTWRQLAALVVMVVIGGGVFALVTFLLMNSGAGMEAATTAAMWVLWPVLLPAAMWGWWRPKGLKPEEFLPFPARDILMKKEVTHGTATGSDGTGNEPLAGRGDRAEAKARARQVRALRRSVSERG